MVGLQSIPTLGTPAILDCGRGTWGVGVGASAVFYNLAFTKVILLGGGVGGLDVLPAII